MNMEHNLILDLMLYKFKLGLNTIEATKIIYCAKAEGTIDHSSKILQELLLSFARTLMIRQG